LSVGLPETGGGVVGGTALLAGALGVVGFWVGGGGGETEWLGDAGPGSDGAGALGVVGAATGGAGWSGVPGAVVPPPVVCWVVGTAECDRPAVAVAEAGVPAVAVVLAEAEAEALPEAVALAVAPPALTAVPVPVIVFPDTPLSPPTVAPAGAGAGDDPAPSTPTVVPTTASTTSPPAATSTFRLDQPRSTDADCEADCQERSASARMTGRRIAWVCASEAAGSNSSR
jgi:hypothetical protein